VVWEDVPVTDTPRRSAPYQEWVLMYRKGLSRGQIADLTGAAPATVGYHLRLAREREPGL
jgi:DNA-directed RNA polymerase specialized sigma24 family protein